MRGLAVGLILVTVAFAGCMTPASVTAALEAPLPNAGLPFLVMVTTCPDELPAGPSLLAFYPGGALHHLRLERATDGLEHNADVNPPHTESERIVLDAERTGALDLQALLDENGEYIIIHTQQTVIAEGDQLDLRRRVTLAGFPALKSEYPSNDAETNCIVDYGAWVDEKYWHVRDSGGAPWTLRHVHDGLVPLHES